MDHVTTSRGTRAGSATNHAAQVTRAPGGYVGSRFSEVWRAVTADPYDALPERRIVASSVLTLLRKNVYADARRTLEVRDDLLPQFDKLVHPVGICLRGHWRITEHTPYTGLFATGSEGLLIARASDALGEHRAGKLRFMGLAGKLYPTRDPDHPTPLKTASFFVLENLAGTHTPHFVDATLSSDLVPIMPHPGVLAKLPVGVVAGAAFALADRARTPAQPAIRQLYPIAELGEPEREGCRAPVVMRLIGSSLNRRIDTPDLREELTMVHHPDGLRFALQVADRRSYLYPSGFRQIGEVVFTESVASYSGDHRLHFWHPPYERGRAEPG